MTIRIGIHGATGRMGESVAELANAQPNRYILAGKYNQSKTISSLQEFCQSSDVIIDFSAPSALLPLLQEAMRTQNKLIIGTTGLSVEHFEEINSAAKKIAVLYTANTSLGANLIAMLAAKSAQILSDYDIEIIEAHHKHKKDAPSGTALMIGKEIATANNFDLKQQAIFDRANNKNTRKSKEIGFASVRGGGIIGEHEVQFAGENEIISIKHQALSRKAFAEGALVAASWIADKAPSLYSMKDIFGII